uniref:Uncharacterized protein n=1 Tax=Panagrolaimus sp. PS1159 TaxID=55785 RepID=A0AC35FBK7_9BILA
MNGLYLLFTKSVSSFPFYNRFSKTSKAIEDAVKTNESESSNNVAKSVGNVSFAAKVNSMTSFDSNDTVIPQTSLTKMLPSSSYKSIEMQKSSNFDESKNNLLEDTIDSIGPCSLSNDAVDEEVAQISKDSADGVETAVDDFEFCDLFWEDDLRVFLYPEDDDPMTLRNLDVPSREINNVSFLNINQ